MSWQPGETIVYRHRSGDGRYLSGFPLTVIDDTPERVVGYLPHGTEISRPAAADGSDLRTIPLDERWTKERIAKRSPFTLIGSRGPGRLIMVFPRGSAYSVWVFRAPERLHGWYVNLEDPHVFGARTISTRDHVLDIWVPGDTGEPKWKDEDELEAAVAAGVRSPEEAAAIRAGGERAWNEHPWPTGFEDYVPDPACPPPELFDGWDDA
ncbi:MAG TPA: DUF402 domain-containing protein [Gaiellaceae bacterium]|jgi:hypothetical protein